MRSRDSPEEVIFQYRSKYAYDQILYNLLIEVVMSSHQYRLTFKSTEKLDMQKQVENNIFGAEDNFFNLSTS